MNLSNLKTNILVFLSFLLFALVVIILVLHGYSSTVNGSTTLAEDYFPKLATTYNFATVQSNGKTLRYIKTGQYDADSPLIIFVHGAPGSWEAFKSYLADVDLKRMAQLISVDRFGYGESDYGQPVTDIGTHANGIREVILANPASKVILVGHSYGGPIVGNMAATYPDLIDGILMVAPVNDPGSEPVRWYAHLSNWSISKALLPDYINVCTAEKMNHIEALQNIKSNWSHIGVPVIHYHGVKDGLAPHDGNVQFSKRHIDESLLTVVTEKGEGHFILWDKKGTVKSMIIDLLVREY